MSKQEIRRKVSFIRRQLKKYQPAGVRAAYEAWLATAEVEKASVTGKLTGSQISVQGVTG